MMTQRHLGKGAEALQPPVIYLVGFGALILAASLEEILGSALARLAICLAFNGVLFAFLRPRLPLAFKPLQVLLGAGLGFLIALPAVATGRFAAPTAVAAAIVLVDAAWEEVLFRGLAFDFAERRYGRWGALALSSLCFAGAHLLDAAAADPLAFAYLILAGLVLGAIRLATGTLWPALALHAAHNLLLSGAAEDDVAWASLAVTAVIVALLGRHLHRTPSQTTKTTSG